MRNISGDPSLVRRLEIKFELKGHTGCVNACSFTHDGNTLITGSDDTTLRLWDWRTGRRRLVIDTSHDGNVFQAKELPAAGPRSIVTCAADGEVRLMQLAESHFEERLLAKHSGRAHKLALNPARPDTFVTCGEDGIVKQIDVRCKEDKTLFNVNRVPLHAIVFNPLKFGDVLAVAGADELVRVYDTRSISSGPLSKLSAYDSDGEYHVTCVDYSIQGELLVSYNDGDVFLFPPGSESTQDGSTGSGDSAVQTYTGHRNADTVKGVTFYGPNHEYVCSGSDCGNVFIWDKETGEILQMLRADRQIANCVEPHPQEALVLATSGLQHSAKIWAPTAPDSTVPGDMEECMKENKHDRDTHQAANLLDSAYAFLYSRLVRGNSPDHV